MSPSFRSVASIALAMFVTAPLTAVSPSTHYPVNALKTLLGEQLAWIGQPTSNPTVGTMPQPVESSLFLPAITYDPGGHFPASVATADLNKDGTVDLIVSNSSVTDGLGAVGVLLGRGDGTFEPTASYSSGGYWGGSAAVGDINGDRHQDVVVANACSTNFSAGNCLTSGSVGLLLGNGDGTLQPVLTYDAGGRFTNSIAVADVNGDHHLDLLAGHYGVSVTVLLGHGDGTFTLGATYASEHEFSVTTADVNNDAIPDLLVANLYNNVAVMLGNGDGTFRQAVT